MAESFPSGNRLLAALPRAELAALLPKLTEVPLTFNETIFERGEIVRHIYFPSNGVISLLASVSERSSLEVGIVGNDGVVGVSAFAISRASTNKAVVQGKGVAMRMKASDFLAGVKGGGKLAPGILRYMDSLLGQVSQSAACNTFHSIDARLAKWLLMMRDRLESDTFPMTQEFLANMLGVRREAISKAAGDLQRGKLLQYSRGNLSILNRSGLVRAACSCYSALIKNPEAHIS